ncbi:Protein of unknown function [Eubacterium uniforme]|uniref:DUF3991 domain-containing protein n=1 Tax=Eubacterium uniforme TaxID=39495 RepID=A0A1T4W6Q9_9FIRM|nr:DUF3991 and TOPRIM domain-containing protein [Eubacterium uniforme]SKA72936.1 Protein of unknown function [Eubacterium uniforme]
MKYVAEELIEKLRNIPIQNVASAMGYHVVKKGNFYSLKEHDSVMIDPRKNKYVRYSSDGSSKSVFDFLIEFGNMDFIGAVNYLNDNYIGEAQISRFRDVRNNNEKSCKLELPRKSDNMRNAFAYLIKTRCLSVDVVKSLANKGYIYQDEEHKNIVFVAYETKEGIRQPVFANLKGTNEQYPYKRDVPGSDYNRCFFLDYKSDTLFITEAIIDALSVMSMQGDDLYKWNYLALTGITKTSSINYWLDNPNIKNIILGLDRDSAGIKATEQIKQMIKEKRNDINVEVIQCEEGFKDFNEELVYKVKRNIPVHKIERNSMQVVELENPFCKCRTR